MSHSAHNGWRILMKHAVSLNPLDAQSDISIYVCCFLGRQRLIPLYFIETYVCIRDTHAMADFCSDLGILTNSHGNTCIRELSEQCAAVYQVREREFDEERGGVTERNNCAREDARSARFAIYANNMAICFIGSRELKRCSGTDTKTE